MTQIPAAQAGLIGLGGSICASHRAPANADGKMIYSHTSGGSQAAWEGEHAGEVGGWSRLAVHAGGTGGVSSLQQRHRIVGCSAPRRHTLSVPWLLRLGNHASHFGGNLCDPPPLQAVATYGGIGRSARYTWAILSP